ncbi:MAG: hypothetical protein ACKVKF_24400, partial [Rhodobacterales bacterium]
MRLKVGDLRQFDTAHTSGCVTVDHAIALSRVSLTRRRIVTPPFAFCDASSVPPCCSVIEQDGHAHARPRDPHRQLIGSC